jgi:hypothetical protein
METTKKEFKDHLVYINEDGPVYSNLRVIAIPNKDGEMIIKWFNQNCNCNSHSNLFDKLLQSCEIDWDMLDKWGIDTKRGIFGAFYSLIGGNSCIPKLVIYGSSSDYQIRNIQPVGLTEYHKAFQKYAERNGFDLLWLITE